MILDIDENWYLKHFLCISQRIFSIAPEAQGLFKFLNGMSGEEMYESEKLIKHASNVINTVNTAVQMLEDNKVDELLPVLKGLGKRHVAYGVLEPHYDVVGQALLATLEAAEGDAFTDEVKAAWTEIYGVISSTMIEGAGYSS